MATAPNETQKTASQMVRDEAQALAKQGEAVALRAAAQATANTQWGKGTDPAYRMAIEKIAKDMGLSTARGELIMLGGNPYITVDGQVKLAHDSGEFEGWEEGALPRDEYADWGIPEDATFAWKVAVYRKGRPRPFVEVGWCGAKRDSNQPVARQFPGELARSRGRGRALQVAFPCSIPRAVDAQPGLEIPDDLYEKAKRQADELPPVRKGEAPKPAKEAAPAAVQPAAEPEPEEVQQSAEVDPVGDLFQS